MNQDSPENFRKELEAKVSALLLGELSADDAELLRKIIEQDPELAKVHDQLKHTIGLVRESAPTVAEQAAEQAAPLKLSSERREKLLAHFKTVRPKEFERPQQTSIHRLAYVAAALTILGVLGAIVAPNIISVRRGEATLTADIHESRSEAASSAKSPPFAINSAPTPPPDSTVVQSYDAGVSRAKDLLSQAQTAASTLGGSSIVLPNAAPAQQEVFLSQSAGSQSFEKGLSTGSTANMWAGDYALGTTPDDLSGASTVSGLAPKRNLRFHLNGDPASPQKADSSSGSLIMNELEYHPRAPVIVTQRLAGIAGNALETSSGSLKMGGIKSEGEIQNQYLVPSEISTIGMAEGNRKMVIEDGHSIVTNGSDSGFYLGYTPTFGAQDSVAFSDKITSPSNSPNRPASTSDAFVGRYASVVLPEDRALDVNYTNSVPAQAPSLTDLPTLGSLFRSQGAKDPESNVPQSSNASSLSPAGISNVRRESRPLGEIGPTTPVSTLSNEQLYVAKQRLADSLNVRSLLNTQQVAMVLTRGGVPVIITDRASANSAEPPTLGGQLRGLFSDEVKRTARLKIERDSADIPGLAAANAQTKPYDPYFIQTESEVINSEVVLGPVVDQLKLAESHDPNHVVNKGSDRAAAIERLKKQVDVKTGKDGTVEVSVRGKSGDEAAQLANSITESYRRHRLQTHTALMTQGIAALEKSRVDNAKNIADAQAEVDRLQKELETQKTDPALTKPPSPAPIPQPEIAAAENPFSTFSLNVSDVSFKLAAASLEKNVLPEPASIRSEEFINAFDYRDPEPAAGAPIAFASERARYPFAHNRDLLRFSIKTAAAGREAGRPLNLVLLLDTSGSMERADRVAIVHEALQVLAKQLQAQDTISVVTFARTPRLWVDGRPGNQAADIVDGLSSLTPEGGTNLEDAMNLAYATALRHYLDNGMNRVVLLTDGAANLGNVSPDSLKQTVEVHRKQGIALDCFGIGWEGYNDDLLEVLTRNGDGRYGFINTPEEAATEFAGQLAGALKVAASDVKVQVEFNPKRVTSYRQIGYAKHQLTKEQFRDNTVDAAEIAAAEAGNALYTVEVNPAGEGPLATVRVRYRVPATSEYREQAWDVPFAGNALPLEQCSAAMRLAATASAFSEWLASSSFASEVTPDLLLRYLNGVPEIYGADLRPKKLEWMIREAKNIQK